MYRYIDGYDRKILYLCKIVFNPLAPGYYTNTCDNRRIIDLF